MSNSHFITNDGENSLAKIMNGIMSKTAGLDFLVGYFYFSGIKELKENILDKQIRILVGMEIESELRKKMSNMRIKETFYKNLVEKINLEDADYFEKEECAFKHYWEKIKNGTLEVRQTNDPCHAKLYIFKYKEEYRENGETPGSVITGSSNLTYNGLIGQAEINVRFNEKHEFCDASEIFEKLWTASTIVIASKDHIEEFENNVIRKTWIGSSPSPYHMYLRVLYEYFNIEDRKIRTAEDITGGKFWNLKYQEDAVKLALSTIEKHNGVIISDVVGLGKSIIASTVANNLNLRTIVIAPPHLCSGDNSWEYYKHHFRFNAEVFSKGKIEAALKHYNDYKKGDEIWLIIIDEAHHYRNEHTDDYKMLHELCMGNKVALLTATPFNNSPTDIYSMLKLFQIPTKSTLQTRDSLKNEFEKLITEYKKLKEKEKNKKLRTDEQRTLSNNISERIRNIINPLIIRRSRLDLMEIGSYRKDLERQKIEFPIVKDPELLDYELGDLSDLYSRTLKKISDEGGSDVFKAARYNPIQYCRSECRENLKNILGEESLDLTLFEESQNNLADFMKKLLVRRFESSQEAFRISLDNMLRNCEKIKTWVERRNCVPIYKKGELPDLNDDDPSVEFPDIEIEERIDNLRKRGLFEIPIEYLEDDFLKDIDSDIELLSKLKDDWKNVTHDPKLIEFEKEITRQLQRDPGRKILVFSQYADTVLYLERELRGLELFAYTSKKSNERNRTEIKDNFDAGAKNPQDKYQVLLATDAISEGYNLNRAGTIFNYDIPYNPTKVIQRVGRINRVSRKMFNELFIYNYFPTDIGESQIRTKAISTLKISMIHAILGEDTKILTNEEELQNYFTEKYKKEQLGNDGDGKSWDAEYRKELDNAIESDAMKEALALPLRTRIRRKISKNKYGVLAFAKRGKDYVFKFVDVCEKIFGDEPCDIGPQTALELLKADADEKTFEVSEMFGDIYDRIKKSLFNKHEDDKRDKAQRSAIDKIKVMMCENDCDANYLNDLKKAIEADAINRSDLRLINKLRPEEHKKLPDKISNDYIQRALANLNDDGCVQELLILSQEITGE